MKGRPVKPSREDLAAAAGKRVPDVIGPGLRILFCGINPGLYSGAVGHHFARPGNRFWPALHRAGVTPRQFSPFEEHDLLALGFGVTNLVARATITSGELTCEELRRGRRTLESKIARHRPRMVAVLGITSYRTAFDRPAAALGLQHERIGDTRLWVLPNPSGLNAHHTLPVLSEMLKALLEAVPE